MSYRNLGTNERVEEDEALDYALRDCGFKLIEPKDALAQEEAKEALVTWFYSGNWIEDNDDDVPDLEEDLEFADRVYQENLDRKWGLI